MTGFCSSRMNLSTRRMGYYRTFPVISETGVRRLLWYFFSDYYVTSLLTYQCLFVLPIGVLILDDRRIHSLARTSHYVVYLAGTLNYFDHVCMCADRFSHTKATANVDSYVHDMRCFSSLLTTPANLLCRLNRERSNGLKRK